MLDGVKQLVEQHRARHGAIAGEKPRQRGHQQLGDQQQRSERNREHRQRIPREEGGLALFRFCNRINILDERHLATARRATPGDARQVVMQRVLLVETAEERDHGLMQYVAMEAPFHKTVEHRDGQKGGAELPEARRDL